MNIVGISYGPPQQVGGGEYVRQVTTTLAAAPAAEASTRVTLGASGTGEPVGDGTLSATGFGKTGIAAYRSIAA